MPPRRFAVGRSDEATDPDTIRAAIAELFATAIFVFAAEGSVLSLGKIFKEVSSTGGLITVAVASGLALAVAVAVAYNLSGGHVNPAVTFGAFVGGRISLVRALVYWVAQLLGSIIASLLLRVATGGRRPVGLSVADGVGELNAFLLEIVLTFGLMYAIYATAIDPKRGNLGTIAPVIIGFILIANILAGGAFDGGAMNPARAFGPSLVGWRWKHHWIYWVGPFVGAGLAGLVYEYGMTPSETTLGHQPLTPEGY